MFVKFNKVSFSYDSSDNILNDVSFYIDNVDNTCTAIVEKNGCCKTTLAKFITGILKPNSGSIEYSNKNFLNRIVNIKWLISKENNYSKLIVR